VKEAEAEWRGAVMKSGAGFGAHSRETGGGWGGWRGKDRERERERETDML
jgi:hypothetical protein